MEAVMIICGYGKIKSRGISKYLDFALSNAFKHDVGLIIPTGGDTTDDSNGHWITEAEMLKETLENIIDSTDLVSWQTMKRMMEMEIVEENKAYNTLTNILYSIKMIKGDIAKTDKIFIVCNTAHLIKVLFALIKIFGLKAIKRRVVICPFPLTRRVGENIKTFLKTPIEVFGYFFRPFGWYLEYWQWWLRTGRNERIGYWKFRLKQREDEYGK